MRRIKSAADLRKCYDFIHPKNLKIKEKIKNACKWANILLFPMPDLFTLIHGAPFALLPIRRLVRSELDLKEFVLAWQKLRV